MDANVRFCKVSLFTSDLSPGWILIDRCGKHFGTILNYLRDGVVPLPESRRETEELLAEAKYYLVQGLVDECQAALQVEYWLRMVHPKNENVIMYSCSCRKI